MSQALCGPGPPGPPLSAAFSAEVPNLSVEALNVTDVMLIVLSLFLEIDLRIIKHLDLFYYKKSTYSCYPVRRSCREMEYYG